MCLVLRLLTGQAHSRASEMATAALKCEDIGLEDDALNCGGTLAESTEEI